VIVLDVNLPGVNGLEACRQITRVNPDAKVIVVTAMEDSEIRQRSLELGASAFVSKMPGKGDDDLLSTIVRLCGDHS
jgi:two-component system invasion response regulator UvrY